jgi:hypothetical protein
MSNSKLTLKTKSKKSEKQINWKECLCHSTGQAGNLSNSLEYTWETFRNAAEIRNNLVHNLLKHYWSAYARGGCPRRCYQTCTSKRNLKYPLKRKIDDNVKVPVTSKRPCLEDKILADRKSREQLHQCLTEDGVSSLKRTVHVPNDCYLVKRLELSYVFYIIKHATKTDKTSLQS